MIYANKNIFYFLFVGIFFFNTYFNNYMLVDFFFKINPNGAFLSLLNFWWISFFYLYYFFFIMFFFFIVRNLYCFIFFFSFFIFYFVEVQMHYLSNLAFVTKGLNGLLFNALLFNDLNKYHPFALYLSFFGFILIFSLIIFFFFIKIILRYDYLNIFF